MTAPAFPHDEKSGDGTHWTTHSGMTLRDWFAGQALAGIITAMANGQHSPKPGLTPRESIANDAYALADILLAARTQEPTPC